MFIVWKKLELFTFKFNKFGVCRACRHPEIMSLCLLVGEVLGR
jgi:hypothetical protein